MKVSIFLSLMLWASSSWASSSGKQAALLEKKLMQIEETAGEMLSANQHFAESLKNAQPANRSAICQVLGEVSETVQSDMKKLKKDIGYLENNKNYTQLTEQQIVRLQQQKGFVNDFSFVSCED